MTVRSNMEREVFSEHELEGGVDVECFSSISAAFHQLTTPIITNTKPKED